MLEEKNEELNKLYVCKGLKCKKNGSDKMSEVLEKVLNTKMDAPLESDIIFLESSTCMGQCSYGPNIKALGKIHTKVDKDVLKRVIIAIRTKLKETP